MERSRRAVFEFPSFHLQERSGLKCQVSHGRCKALASYQDYRSFALAREHRLKNVATVGHMQSFVPPVGRPGLEADIPSAAFGIDGKGPQA